MNWLKIIITGFICWGFPFLLTEIIFTEIPESFTFILYLIGAVTAAINHNQNLASGYLRRRIRLTISSGIMTGFVWFIIACSGSGFYYLFYLEENLMDYLINKVPIFLIYIILMAFYGFCEERRGRRR